MMKLWTSLLLFLAVSTILPALGFAQSPSLAGEWRVGSGERVIVIEQDGMKVRGSWKQSYTNKDGTCSGVWFEGTVSEGKISGIRHPCGGKAEPLDAKIVNNDTVQMSVFARGRTPTTTRLRRVK